MIASTIDNGKTFSGSEGTLLANRYRIVRQLGQGGMGSVWLAEDAQLDNKQFAIKMLPSILVSNKRAYNQLKSEALVAMKLSHPNIVTLRAFEENNGNPFLVMDYIDGQTLDDYLAEKGNGEWGMGGASSLGGLPEDEVVRILKPIAAALDYAHKKGVVHRDVKPGNIMVAKDGTPYILDFGISREMQETMTRVTGKLSSGTLLYMSPEQLNGDAPKPAQDVYSFAAMVYECMSGHPPFYRGAIEDQIKNKQPGSLGRTRFCSSVMSGLAKNPEDRPPTCEAVLGSSVSINSCDAAEVEEVNVDIIRNKRNGCRLEVNRCETARLKLMGATSKPLTGNQSGFAFTRGELTGVGILLFATSIACFCFMKIVSIDRGFMGGPVGFVTATLFWGIGACVGGIWLVRRWKCVLIGHAVAALGVAALYIGFGLGHRFFDPPVIASANYAFAALVVVTAFSGVMAVCLCSPFIAVMALVGGYLAPVIAGRDSGFPLSFDLYLVVLNLGVFYVARRLHWSVLDFLASMLAVSMCYIWSTLHAGFGGYAAMLVNLAFLSIVHALYMTSVIVGAKNRRRAGNDIACAGLCVNAIAYFVWFVFVFKELFSGFATGLLLLALVAESFLVRRHMEYVSRHKIS